MLNDAFTVEGAGIASGAGKAICFSHFLVPPVTARAEATIRSLSFIRRFCMVLRTELTFGPFPPLQAPILSVELRSNSRVFDNDVIRWRMDQPLGEVRHRLDGHIPFLQREARLMHDRETPRDHRLDLESTIHLVPSGGPPTPAPARAAGIAIHLYSHLRAYARFPFELSNHSLVS